ncbi:hypothetical protein ABT247_23520 [Kitasatospora sp. NPDC001539]|uniref:hypothetical protein n=1 Tax=Kitasatospora sp. NPDC001539 TaxID=3154384 RepID=UPI0033201893
MNSEPPEASYPSAEARPPSVPDPTRVLAACGVSAAAGLHLIVAALVLINRSH